MRSEGDILLPAPLYGCGPVHPAGRREVWWPGQLFYHTPFFTKKSGVWKIFELIGRGKSTRRVLRKAKAKAKKAEAIRCIRRDLLMT